MMRVRGDFFFIVKVIIDNGNPRSDGLSYLSSLRHEIDSIKLDENAKGFQMCVGVHDGKFKLKMVTEVLRRRCNNVTWHKWICGNINYSKSAFYSHESVTNLLPTKDRLI